MCKRFAFNNNGSRIEHLSEKKQSEKKKIKQNARNPQINPQRFLNIERVFLYKKWAYLAGYQNRKEIKHTNKAQECILPNTLLSNTN